MSETPKVVDKRKKKLKEGVAVVKIGGVDAEIDKAKTTALAEELAKSTERSALDVLQEAFKDHPHAEHGKGDKLEPSDFD